jgi:hypothetical protein
MRDIRGERANTRILILLQVKLIDNLETINLEDFSVVERTWSATLSDGSEAEMKTGADGAPLDLDYADREEYSKQVRTLRMEESDKQVP